MHPLLPDAASPLQRLVNCCSLRLAWRMNRAGRPLVALALMLAVQCPADTVAEEKTPSAATALRYDLRPRFIAGRGSRYSFWESRNMQTWVAGPGGERNVELNMTTEGVLLWSVVTVREDGAADCEIVIDYVVVTVESPAGELRIIDSRQLPEDDDRTHRWLSALTATPLRFRMLGDGSVERFESLDEIRAAVDANRPGMNASMFIEQASTLATMPGAPAEASVGTSWQRQEQWSRDYGGFPVQLDHRTKYDFENVARIAGIDVVTVRGNSQLDGRLDGQRMSPNAPPVDMQMSAGEVTTRIMFDMASHEVVGSDTVETVTLDLEMSIRDIAITTRIDERIHSQVMRVAEVDEPSSDDADAPVTP